MPVRLPHRRRVLVAALAAGSLLAPAAPGVELSEVPESKYLMDLSPGQWPSAKAPADPGEIRWDFSGSTSTSWLNRERETQTITDHSVVPLVDKVNRYERRSLLILDRRGDGTARLATQELRVTDMDTGLSQEFLHATGGQPTYLTEWGATKAASQDHSALFNPVLRLPIEAAVEGAKSEYRVTYPDPSGGSIPGPALRGDGRVTLEGYAEVDGRLVVRLRQEVGTTTASARRGDQGAYSYAARLTAYTWFDPVAKVVVRAQGVLVSKEEREVLPAEDAEPGTRPHEVITVRDRFFELLPPPPPAPQRMEEALARCLVEAKDIPYASGGIDENGLSHLGFVRWVYRKADIGLPPSLLKMATDGKRVQRASDLRPGDLLFFHGAKDKDIPVLATLVVSPGEMATFHPKKGLWREKISHPSFKGRFLYARRFLQGW